MKKSLHTVLFVSFCILSTSQKLSAQSDDCPGPTLYSSTSCNTSTGSVDGATPSGEPQASCDGYSGSPHLKDVWYKFEAIETTHLITIYPSGDLDAVICIYPANCSSSEMYCEDTPGGNGGTAYCTTSGLTPGDYYYIRIYDYGSVVPTNGDFDICITHTPSNQYADLTLTGVTVNPLIMEPGDYFDVSGDAENNGQEDADLGDVEVFISDDPYFSINDDDFLDQVSDIDLYAGDSDPFSLNIQLDYSTSPGTKYIIVYIDQDEDVDEGSNENNNMVAIPITVNSSLQNSLELFDPSGGENWQVGSTQEIKASIDGDIDEITLEYSINGGSSWTMIDQFSAGPISLDYPWEIPNSPSTNCKVRITVNYNIAPYTLTATSNTFSITTIYVQDLDINVDLSHLYWPFYLSNDINAPNPFSLWEGQIEGQSSDGQVTYIWRYSDDHDLDDDGGPCDHHCLSEWWAQDWNYKDGYNSECDFHFYSPLGGTVLWVYDNYLQSDCNIHVGANYGNTVVIQPTGYPEFAFRVGHLKYVNSIEIYQGNQIDPLTYIGEIGNTGASDYAHAHCELNKNLSESDVQDFETFGYPPDFLQYAADFKFDAIYDGSGGIGIANIRLENQFIVFPNPFYETFTIETVYTNIDSKSLSINIKNLLGQLILSTDFRSPIQISGATWEKGLYLIEVREENKIINTLKAVKL